MENKLTSLDHCLRPLLKLLKWEGSERMLFESLPHHATVETIEQFQLVMHNLNYVTESMTTPLAQVDVRLFPCLFMLASGVPYVLIEKSPNGILVYDGVRCETVTLNPLDLSGTLITVKKQTAAAAKTDAQHWFRTIFFKEKKLLWYVSFLTLLQTFLLLAPSVYMISVYDKVIAAHSFGMLLTFACGILIAMAALGIIMLLRTRFLGYIGTHIQKNVGNVIFKQLLKLPPLYTENASVAMQMMRLNDFNVVRNFFSSSLFTALLEFPYLFIYFVAVWVIAGVLVLIPLAALLISFCIAVGTYRWSLPRIRESLLSKSDYQDFLLESFWEIRSLQYAGLQEKWLARFRDISAKASFYNKELAFSGQVNDVVFDMLTLLSGLATLVVGTVMVIGNTLQVGALIGTMFIIWRILGPIKSLNTMLPKLMQLKMSSAQMNELMKLPVELPTERQWKSTPQYILGSIAFSQVTFRYPSADTPALKNISFTLKTGQTMVVVGPSASGKSTMANLMLAIYTPQAGHIYIDNRNIKQFDVNVLRKNIAYVLQKSELFYGTVAQNIALSNPLATEEQIIEAAKAAHLLKDIESLPEGLHTYLRFYSDEKLGAAFCQKINLARAYLRDAPILILDEPTGTLDEESLAAFEFFLSKIKGKKTVILFAHDPKFLHLADIGMILYDGYIVTAGDPKTVWENLPKGMV